MHDHVEHLLLENSSKNLFCLNLFFFSFFPPFSNNTVVGDKTLGGSTANTASITSTTLLLQHDGQDPDMKTETQRKASFPTCLHL